MTSATSHRWYEIERFGPPTRETPRLRRRGPSAVPEAFVCEAKAKSRAERPLRSRWGRTTSPQSDEPTHPIQSLHGRVGEEGAESHYKVIGITEPAAVEAPWRCEYHAGMMLARRSPGANDTVEILDVFGHDGPSFGRGEAKQVLIGKRREAEVTGRCEHFVAFRAEQMSGPRGVVDVEQQSHSARSRWRRFQRASASSAAAALVSISALISSGNEAK